MQIVEYIQVIVTLDRLNNAGFVTTFVEVGLGQSHVKSTIVLAVLRQPITVSGSQIVQILEIEVIALLD